PGVVPRAGGLDEGLLVREPGLEAAGVHAAHVEVVNRLVARRRVDGPGLVVGKAAVVRRTCERVVPTAAIDGDGGVQAGIHHERVVAAAPVHDQGSHMGGGDTDGNAAR